MIPSALTTQFAQGLADFLRYSLWSSTPGMEHVIDDLLDEHRVHCPLKSGTILNSGLGGRIHELARY
jgi:hypothetical protein